MRRTPALLATLPLLALGLAGCGGGADRTFTDVDASVCDSLDLDQAITAQFPDAQVGKVKPTFDQGWICRVTVTKASVEKGIALTTVSVLVRVTDDDASATQAYG